MATVTRENIGLLNDKLTVTISKEDYLKKIEEHNLQKEQLALENTFTKPTNQNTIL